MLHNLWLQHLDRLMSAPRDVSPRGIATRELLDQRLVLEDSRQNLLDVAERKLNFRFAVAEWLWMSFGLSDVETVATYNSVMRQFSDDGVRLTGAYGPHINYQRRKVVERLRRDPSTRQAVIEIPRPQLDPTKDEPCTLSLQFLIRPDVMGRRALHCIVTMRSSDVWLGIPYDVFSFTQIQSAFAGMLGVRRGWLSLHMGSSHLYERDVAAAQGVLETFAPGTITSPDLPDWPPQWLEHVLRDRDMKHVPEDAPLCWRTYAMVLTSPSSEAARGWLR